MTREDAFKLAEAVADQGYHVTVSISPMKNHVPSENVQVSLPAVGFEMTNVQKLVTLGEEYGMYLHIFNGNLLYLEHAK